MSAIAGAAARPTARGRVARQVVGESCDAMLFFCTFGGARISGSLTSRFARLADVAGFDLYPLNARQHDRSPVYDAQRQFTRLDGPLPTFHWIKTGPVRPSYRGGFTMTPAEPTAEAWLAVAGGARDRLLHVDAGPPRG